MCSSDLVKENVKKSMEELKKINQLYNSLIDNENNESEKKQNIINKLVEIENQNNINNRTATFYYKEKTRIDVIIDVLLTIYIILIIACVVIIIATKKYKDFKLFLITAAFILPLILFNIVYDFLSIRLTTPKEPTIQGDLTLKAMDLTKIYKDVNDFNLEEEKNRYEQTIIERNETINNLENKLSSYEGNNELHNRVSEEISKLLEGSITQDEIRRMLTANISAKNISLLTNNIISEEQINNLLEGNY